MTLATGTRLGPYEIVSLLGAGGMGEVYRALDPRLGRGGRPVAIKVLPSSASQDPDRMRRFKLEASSSSELNHPNILTIYDIGTQDDTSFIVSELLEGENLRDHLGDGPLPIRKSIDYAIQIAKGLAAAHERGIVHRDLKPENIFITKDERAKILDFGLARLIESRDENEDQTDVPTRKLNTNPGTIMGTVGYMSPEQATGKPADHRSDIFSLGAVVYEMLTGHRTFSGDSEVETLNAIVKEDPSEFSQVTDRAISPAIENVVRHCLEKRPERRFQSANDVAFALETISGSSSSTTGRVVVPVAKQKVRERIAWGIAALFLFLFLLATIVYFRAGPPGKINTTSFTVPPPSKTEFPDDIDYYYSSAISPDGQHLVLVTRTQGRMGRVQLWLRSLDSVSMQPLSGTEGATNPFWSPDGRFIGFFADGKLKKIDLAGGPPQTICNAPSVATGTWNSDGVILFNKHIDGIYRVAATGGEPVQVTKPDRAREELYHFWPRFLPDGRNFLYLARQKQSDSHRIYLGSLDGGAARSLLQASSRAAYASPGYLLYVRDATLLAQPFDLKTQQLSGNPLPVADGLFYFYPTGCAEFSVSDNGVLAFRGGRIISRLVWLNRNGIEAGSLGLPGDYGKLQLSPDGKSVVVDLRDPREGTNDIWIYDLARGSSRRVTFDVEQEVGGVWSPDGRELVFSRDKDGPPHLFVKDLNSADEAQQLLPVSGGVQIAFGWSADGQKLLYGDQGRDTGNDLWILPMTGERKPYPFLRTNSDEWDARVSPDGHWVAYASNESGRPEIYVSPFQNSGERWQVSNAGGTAPKWRGDEKELFYISADGIMMAVPLKPGSTFDAGSPIALFKSPTQNSANYDVTADGQRFLINSNAGEPSVPITVFTSWTANLKR